MSKIEMIETAPHMDVNGWIFTTWGRRVAAKRDVEKYQDPRRVLSTIYAAAAVIAPEVVLSYGIAVDATEAVTGVHSGAHLSDIAQLDF
jgi:hypothetical protein